MDAQVAHFLQALAAQKASQGARPIPVVNVGHIGTPPGGMQFDPNAPLDTSQVQDDRPPPRMQEDDPGWDSGMPDFQRTLAALLSNAQRNVHLGGPQQQVQHHAQMPMAAAPRRAPRPADPYRPGDDGSRPNPGQYDPNGLPGIFSKLIMNITGNTDSGPYDSSQAIMKRNGKMSMGTGNPGGFYYS